MIISTTPTIQGAEIKKYLGVVTTNEVLGVNIFSEITAAFSDGWGGRSGTFRRKFDELNQYVQTAITQKARLLGANAIVGYRVDFNEISGKGKEMFFAYASGTAVLIDSTFEEEMVERNADRSIVIYDSQLNDELKKIELLNKLSFYTRQDSWEFLESCIDDESAKKVVDKCDESFRKPGDGQLYYEDFVKYASSYFDKVNSFEVTSYLYEKMLVSTEAPNLEKIIKNASMFEPSLILKMLQGDEKSCKQALNLLMCPKKDYSEDDIRTMIAIKTAIKMDIKGSVGTRKGMFGTKQVFICPDGHETDNSSPLEECYCSKCGKNAYGYTYLEMKAISEYTKRVDDLLLVTGIKEDAE